ncbi:tRNA (adenosine(37)-N6)-threonylcarbamoyltransferase complex transferase subunit TsaD [Candidatus Saccharibacteria bacterium]|nr:tRNA (adenosine(37)-N6)-threonylcarbamoyltransferase complex transferase subunit TsaD [Candidatus Saccharibacteria bacterium]
MKILGIETSCDETAAAVVEDGTQILSNVVVSQIDIFAEYGGVIPEVAARSHLEAMMPVVNKALSDAGCTWEDIDAIAVTHAPGLLGSLLIGTLTARTLAILHDKPLYAVHHLKSHVYANWLSSTKETKPVFSSETAGSGAHILSRAASARPIAMGGRRLSSPCQAPEALRKNVEHHPPIAQTPQFPLIALVISGGHTQILYMPAHNQFEIIGTTRDDAVGECFDKVAKILGLPYPGGPAIAKAALEGDAEKYKLPHPKIEGLDFSFSGLKTAVLRAVQKELGLPISHPSYDLKNHLSKKQVADFAASFQKTAVEILCEKLALTLEQYPDVQSVVIAGGVSANKALREALPEAYFPAPSLSGDNGAMVAAAAYYEIISGVEPTDPYSLNIYPRISIEK